MDPYVPMSPQMMVAKDWGDTDAVRRLLEEGADVTALDDRPGVDPTLLHWAARRGDAELTALLLDKGARIDEGDEEGMTPLMLAAYEGHLDVVRTLLARGADVHAETHGWRAIDWAKLKGRDDVARLLEEAGAAAKPRGRARQRGGEIPRAELERREAAIRRELRSRPANRKASEPWVGAWEMMEGIRYVVFHADGTCVWFDEVRPMWEARVDFRADGTFEQTAMQQHVEFHPDGTHEVSMRQNVVRGKWSISPDGQRLRWEYPTQLPFTLRRL